MAKQGNSPLKHRATPYPARAACTARASFLLAVGRQSAELAFGGSPLGSHGGGMPARSGGSWSMAGLGDNPVQVFRTGRALRPALGVFASLDRL
jgi:hypothetical protein